MLDGALGISQALLLIFQARQQHQVMPLGQLSNRLLDNFGIRPGFGKGAHVHQVGAGKSLHFRKGGAQNMRQSLDLPWQFLDDIGNELWVGPTAEGHHAAGISRFPKGSAE